MRIHEFLNEVLDIGKKNKAPSLRDAAEMFLDNVKYVRNPGAYHFPGADHVEWARLYAYRVDLEDSVSDFLIVATKYKREIENLRHVGLHEYATKFICEE